MNSGIKKSLSKISRPEGRNIVIRSRLLRHLDTAANKQIIWITSPAGSGKTSLVCSYLQEKELPCIWYQCDQRDSDLPTFFYYMAMAADIANPNLTSPLPLLTPEYLLGIPTFTRRFFEELYGGLIEEEKYFIVLDNYQDIPADSHFHEMLVLGLDVLPPGIVVVIISRHEPPPQFARLRANKKLSVIGWNEIRFTVEETAEVINTGRRKELTREEVTELHKTADGWIAALVLLLEKETITGTETVMSDEFVSEKVFDYFAQEIFNKSANDLQKFLLKTAFLPAFSATVAEKITGSANAGRVLSALNRQNYFTERLSGEAQEYRYHPLFRDFLKSRAKVDIVQPELSRILGEAALILAESGQIEEAAQLFIEICDWNQLGYLLTGHAGAFICEGRNQTLEKYLRAFPSDLLDTAPQLLYWLGICRMPFDVAESRKILEKALHGADISGNMVVALAAWSAIVDSIITEHYEYTGLDTWIDWFEEHEAMLDYQSAETEGVKVGCMLFALTFRQPWHLKTVQWARKAEAFLGINTNLPITMMVGSRLLMHYTFFGEIRRAEFMMQNIRPPDSDNIKVSKLMLIQWQVIHSAYAALGSVSPTDCMKAANHGLKLSQEHGIHAFVPLLLYFGAVGGIISGDDTLVDSYLAEMVSAKAGFNEMHLAYYVALLAWKDLIHGDAKSAAERIGMCLTLTEKLGHTINVIANYVGLAHAVFELGRREEAIQLLDKARSLSSADSRWCEYMFCITEAYFAFKEDNNAAGLELAGKALALGKQYGVAMFIYWRPAVVSLICTKALEACIEVEYVRELIQKQHLKPDTSDAGLENWPWPLRIRTMGGFHIFMDDVPLKFTGKSPQKPLELLKALIAFGGSNVPTEQLTDALWPDADGDLAQRSLDTTLFRLRRLLGGDNHIRHSAQQLSLDPQYCRVDSMALEDALNRFGDLSDEQIPSAYSRVADLYKGDFLPADAGREWAVMRSEKLKSKLLRAVERTGRLHERNEQWERAVDCYLKGLEADSLAEDIYNRILICYQKLGRRTDAVKLYNRFRTILKSNLGIDPSPETEALYTSILK